MIEKAFIQNFEHFDNKNETESNDQSHLVLLSALANNYLVRQILLYASPVLFHQFI